MISSATPPQMKPVVSVTTTSGTREQTTIRPLIAPIAAPATKNHHRQQQRLAEARLFHRAGGENIGDRHHRTDGKIDAARDHHHRLRRGGESQRQGAHGERLQVETDELGMNDHGDRE